MTTMTTPNQLTDSAPQALPTATDPLAERLQRLNQRRQPSIPGDTPAAPSHKPPSNRRRPAKRAKTVALALSFAATGGLTYYFSTASGLTSAQTLAFEALPTPIAVQPATVTTAPSTTAGAPAQPAPAPTAPASTSPVSTTPTTPAPSPAVAFDGATVNTRYGPVQVQAQITNGTLTDIAVIQYPNGDGESVDINRAALPQLRTAALTAQSAQVNTVSGATYTTDGYKQSLQSALDQARAAGATALA